MKNLLLVLVLAFPFCGIHLFAQPVVERTIKGMVTDEMKDPLLFASVMLKNSDKGTVTDLDGKFQITIPDSCKYLIVTYTGYTTEEVNVVGKDSIVVVMKPGVQLGPVVVTDFKIPIIECDNTTQGRLKTAEQIRNLPVKNINALAGSTAGLSSIDGGDVSIRGSRSSATEYYVDGVRATERPKASVAESPTPIPTASASVADHVTETKNLYSAGQLTAGEINDFGKWVLWNDESQQELTMYREEWKIYPLHRYMVIVQNIAGIPVINQAMYLLDAKKDTVWRAKTDNTGKAELWSNMFEEKYKDRETFNITTTVNDKEYRIEKAQPFEQGVNQLVIKSDCHLSTMVDAVFVVDATGSMSDEIKYLQEELTDVMQKIKQQNPDLTLNLGSVFYRDHGDEYVTRTSALSSDISKTMEFVQNQSAAGGGDGPEAVDEALEIAVRNMNWNPDARTKLIFAVLDASPHNSAENLNRLRDITYTAAKEGIRIIPLAASGIDKGTEYLMRSMALCTNGTYVFLSNHSGIGNPHLEPTTDRYNVEKLNDLIIRLFDQYIEVVSCAKEFEQDTLAMSDTLEITSRELFTTDTFKNNVPIHAVKELQKITCTYYPNPTSGLLNIEVKGQIQELFLCDTSGKLLQRFEVNGEDKVVADISTYPIGIYRILYFESQDVPRSGMVVLAR